MFSASDIKSEVFSTTYRRGRELYEMGAVQDFTYDIYIENGLPKADVSGKVRGAQQDFYYVTAIVDEEFAEVSSMSCECEAFYNYEGMCKHCVALLLNYVSRRQAKDILQAKRADRALQDGNDDKGKDQIPVIKTAAAFKNLLNQYSLKAGAAYLIPETVYGKVELEPYFKIDYSYATVEFKI